jgi:hypothetical protein
MIFWSFYFVPVDFGAGWSAIGQPSGCWRSARHSSDYFSLF